MKDQSRISGPDLEEQFPSLDGAATLTPPPSGSAVGRRVAWMIADQGLSSASNIGTAIVAARTLDRLSFGGYGLAFTVYVLSIGSIRALVTEPLVSLYSRVDPESLHPTLRASTGSATGLGLIASAVIAIGAALVGGIPWQALGTLAIVLPGLVLQDAWRYCFVAGGRPKAALLNDAIWCGAQAIVLVLLLSYTHPTLVTIILWWGGSGVLAGLVGCLQASATPELTSTWRWIRQHGQLSGRYAAEYAVASGSSQVTLLALPAIAGLAALGAIRGAQLFFGPIVVLFGGAYLALGSEGARLRSDPARLRRLLIVSSTGLFAVASALLLVAIWLPVGLGRLLFGDTWITARRVIVPVGLAVLGSCVASGAIVGLRALAAARASLRARLQSAPLGVAIPLLGALDGARGFAIGTAVATWVGAVIWWRQFCRALTEDVAPTSSTGPPDGS